MNRNKTVSLITFAVALLLFSSCRTGRQVVVVEARDSVRVEERVREIKVTDTLFVEVPMQKESTTVRDSSSHLENDYAVSNARINPDGSLYHSLETKARTDTITGEVSVQVRDTTIYREKVIPKVVTVEKKLNWFENMRLWIGNVILALAGLSVLYVIMKFLIRR